MTVREMPRLLTTDEVADLFGCGPNTICRLVSAGRLRAVRLSGPRAPRCGSIPRTDAPSCAPTGRREDTHDVDDP